MAEEPLSVLSADPEAVDQEAPELDDRALSDLLETLLLVRELDRQLAEQQENGSVGLWVPAGEAAAPAAGLASALEPGDWLYPSFRDWAAYLVRGGSLRHLVAQALGSASDPQLGRQLAGQPSLDEGRYVAPSASAGAGILRAAGTAVAIALRGDERVAAALFGAASAEQPGFWLGLQEAASHRAPLVMLCRRPADSRPEPSRRAEALDIATERVDGADLLALIKVARAARERARAGDGPTLIEAVLATEPADPVARLRPFLEHRGLSDPGRDSELAERCRQRVSEQIEAARTEGAPDPGRLLDDVTERPTWMLREQREQLLDDDS